MAETGTPSSVRPSTASLSERCSTLDPKTHRGPRLELKVFVSSYGPKTWRFARYSRQVVSIQPDNTSRVIFWPESNQSPPHVGFGQFGETSFYLNFYTAIFQRFQYLSSLRSSSTRLRWSSCKQYLSGITYFYRHICNREVDDRFGLPPRPRGSKLPVVLSMEEVARLLSCVKNLKHRVLLKTMYSAGLRVGETISLRPEHIESDPSRMVIRVDQGKGRKDRYSVLSKRLLKELRVYWREYSPKHWLFPGQKAGSHLTYGSAHNAFALAKKKPA